MFLNKYKDHLSLYVLSGFWLIALLNPVFKKYDYGAEFPLVVLLGVLLIFLAYAEFRVKRENNYLEKVFLLIFVAAYIASFVFSQTRNIGFSEVLAYLSCITVYLFFANRKIAWMESFFKVVAGGVLLSVLVGFLLYFFTGEPRMTGTFFNILYHANEWPNAFALLLLAVWPLFIIIANKKWNLAYSVALGFIFAALLLTYSRGAFLVFVGQGVLMLLYFWRSLKPKIFAHLLLILALSVGIFYYANFIRSVNHETINLEERVNFENNEGLTSKQERVDFWLGAADLAEEKPLLGWGPFSFRYAYNSIQKTFLGASDHPHNVFLKIASENGLIALGAFIAFLLSILVLLTRRFPALSQKKKDSSYLIFVSLAGIFAHNLIDYNLNFIANLLLLFLLLAFLRSNLVSKDRKEKSAYFGLILTVLVAIFSLYEGGTLAVSYLKPDVLNYSLYPRGYYLGLSEKALLEQNYPDSILFATEEIERNPLDAQAYFLRGSAYCELKETETCRQDYAEALELNPQNDFVYYNALLGLDLKDGLDESEKPLFDKAYFLLNEYFDYVQNNVHFTAYTQNVENAAKLAEAIAPFIEEDLRAGFLAKKEHMLKKAQELRLEKTF